MSIALNRISLEKALIESIFTQNVDMIQYFINHLYPDLIYDDYEMMGKMKDIGLFLLVLDQISEDYEEMRKYVMKRACEEGHKKLVLHISQHMDGITEENLLSLCKNNENGKNDKLIKILTQSYSTRKEYFIRKMEKLAWKNFNLDEQDHIGCEEEAYIMNRLLYQELPVSKDDNSFLQWCERVEASATLKVAILGHPQFKVTDYIRKIMGWAKNVAPEKRSDYENKLCKIFYKNITDNRNGNTSEPTFV